MTTENELNRRNAERHGASDKTLPRLTERGFLTKASERRHDFLTSAYPQDHLRNGQPSGYELQRRDFEADDR